VAVVPSPAASPTSAATVYVVKKGDTLWAIANKFDVSLAALREANPQVTDPTKLRVGTELSIPSQ
jgi:LysM repeat protein